MSALAFVTLGLARALLRSDVDTDGREPLDGARCVVGALRGAPPPTCVRVRLGLTTRVAEADLAGTRPAPVRGLLGGDTLPPRGAARRVPVDGKRRCKVGRALGTDRAGRRGEAEDGVARLGARPAGLVVATERPVASSWSDPTLPPTDDARWIGPAMPLTDESLWNGLTMPPTDDSPPSGPTLSETGGAPLSGALRDVR